MKFKPHIRSTILIVLLILAAAFLSPQPMDNPVVGANDSSWNHNTFWYYPWGQSVVHKGIDIFAPIGTPITTPQRGIVIYRGEIERGGKVIAILSPLLRIHYYAHLADFHDDVGHFVSKGDTIGYVGATGNAQSGPPHLHYTILTPVPYPWRWSSSEVQGWRKIFYLDPGEKIVHRSYF